MDIPEAKEMEESDFSHKEYLDKTNVDLIIKCPSYQKAEEIKKLILWNQGFHNDITKFYIEFLEGYLNSGKEVGDIEKVRDIEQVITDIKQIEAGDFFGEDDE